MTHIDDTDLEARLRDWGAWALDTAPDTTGHRRLDWSDRHDRQGRHGAWLAVAASIAVVLAVVAALIVTRTSHSTTPPATQNTPTPQLRSAIPAPGMRAISFHGLTVDVPKSWSQNTQPCAPTVSTVYLPTAGSQPACGRGTPPPGVTLVNFSAATIPRTAHATTISGVPALRTTYDPRTQTVQFEVPSLTVAIAITTTDTARRDALIASLRIVDVDIYGCATRHAIGLPPTQAPARAGADIQLVPAGEVRFHVCRYSNGLLDQGALLTAVRNVAALSTVLNDLPPGRNAPLSETNPASDLTTYVAVADYPTGASLQIVIRIAGSGNVGASNGAHASKYEPRVLEVLSGLVGPPAI